MVIIGFIEKLTKTTEKSTIKYKILCLYSIFRYFSIFFVDLIAVHEVLPDDVCRRGDRRNGVEKRLRHPHRQHRILLSERLPARHDISVAASEHAARLELYEADRKRHEGQPRFEPEIGVVQIEDESRRAGDHHRERHEPQVERDLAVVADPARRLRREKPAHLRRGERHDEQRCDPGENLRERAGSVARERQNDGGRYGNGHVAQQAVSGHRRHVGPEHAADHDGGHGNRRQHANHASLRQNSVQRTQREEDRHATHDLKEQHPQMEHTRPHLFGFHAAEGKEEHQKDQRRRDHLVRPRFERRDRTAQQGSDHHPQRHRNGLDVAMQVLHYVHFIPKFRQ